MCAVPREEDRTARELALRLDDVMQASRFEIELGLEHAIGPVDRGDSRRARCRASPIATGCRL